MTERDETSASPFNLGQPAAGMSIGGRFRLLTSHGNRPRLQFWEAVDIASGQHVALTLVDPDGELPEEFVNEILARTVRLKGVDMPGLARVFEVVHTGRFGVVVCEWIHGDGLREIADTCPSPAGVASAMQSLAAATEVAHRAGLVLSIDDSSRLRIAVDGRAALVFPATMPEASIPSDMRGIGQAIQELVGSREELPFLISTVISGLLEGGIGSAATLVTLLRQATIGDEPGGSVMPPLEPPAPGFYAGFRNFGADERAAAARRQVMRIGLVTTVMLVVVALVALGSTLNRVFGTKHEAAGIDADKLGLNTATAQAAPPTLRKDAAVGDRVQPVAAAVFAPDGSPDSPETAGLTIDGNPATAWSTDTYYDPDPFPKFKSGLGLLVQLAQPTALSAVTVDLNSTGTVVQVRSATNAAPKTLAETGELSPPTPMRPGRNRIGIGDPARVSTVLVWISALGSADGKSRSAMAEIELQAASPPA